MAQSTVNLRTFRNLVSRNKKKFRNFLTRLEKKAPRNLHLVTLEANELSWAKTDCLRLCQLLQDHVTNLYPEGYCPHFEIPGHDQKSIHGKMVIQRPYRRLDE